MLSVQHAAGPTQDHSCDIDILKPTYFQWIAKETNNVIAEWK